MKLFDRLLPDEVIKRKWTSVFLTVITTDLLTLWIIYGMGEYGIALFLLMPLLMGFGSTILLGYKKEITRKQAAYVGFITLGVFTACLLVFAIEGLICIVMAAPFALILTWIGSVLGYYTLAKATNNASTLLFILLGSIPATAFYEKDTPPSLTAVTTAVEIDATPEKIWQNVIAFPQLKEPTEFLFQTGIAYPINATIKGTGVGAVRYCNFTTGSFIEPVTVWDEHRLLKFDVVEQPAPMKEISFWRIDAPHLHDYFVSKRGQFKIITLANGKTRLEGTTWYYHNIKPAIYWQLWSNYIIHKIHERVLNHIKTNAEEAMTNSF